MNKSLIDNFKSELQPNSKQKVNEGHLIPVSGIVTPGELLFRFDRAISGSILNFRTLSSPSHVNAKCGGGGKSNLLQRT